MTPPPYFRTVDPMAIAANVRYELQEALDWVERFANALLQLSACEEEQRDWVAVSALLHNYRKWEAATPETGRR